MSDRDTLFIRAEIVAYLATTEDVELDDIVCHTNDRRGDVRRAVDRLIREGVISANLHTSACDSCGTEGKVKTETFTLNPESRWLV